MYENYELNEQIIKELLCSTGIVPVVYRTIDSTNLEMKRRIQVQDESAGLIIASEQTMGRGRLGRSFESPAGSGIYMSLRIKPELSPDNMVLITSAAAVAVCRGIMSLSFLKPEIKWVNDIYLRGRKVCGILAEAVTDSKGNTNVILGMGINVTTTEESFSDAVREVAGALFNNNEEVEFTLNQLAAAVIKEFYLIYCKIITREFIKDYRKFSMVIGKPVRYFESGIWYEGVALDVDDDGGLVVEDIDGKINILKTGEITLRLKSS